MSLRGNPPSEKCLFFTSAKGKAQAQNWDLKKRKARTANRDLKKRKASAASEASKKQGGIISYPASFYGGEIMESLKIYRVTDKYIRYMHGADSRVQYNKGAHRPYVGVVLTVGSYKYFVPMESPKANHKQLKPSTHIMPLDNGKYGILGFNNMIPVPSSALIVFDINGESDKHYAELLRRQAYFINRHKADVYDRASKTYFLATTKNKDSFFVKVCCNFKKLERACDKYDPNYQHK